MPSLAPLPSSNRISIHSDHEMSPSSAYSLQLPYLGTIPLGKSLPNLASFQKPLRELYISYYRQRRERYHEERRIIISDRDILIFEPDAASKGKRSLIYSTLESIIDVQALELYVIFNHSENHHHKRIRAAFLPIGCEHQERFRPLYSTIDKSQYNLLSIPSSSSSCHPPLIAFVMRKVGTGGTCSLLDCHVFAVRREAAAFELCDMIRKLIIKRTMSPILPSSTTATGTTLLRIHDNDKETTVERRTKYLNRDRPISAMEHRQADILTGLEKKNDRHVSNNHLNGMIQSTSNFPINPLPSSASFQSHDHHPAQTHHDKSQVLHIEHDIHQMSPPCSTSMRTLTTKHQQQQQQQQQQQRHFIKASSSTSSLVIDESDEVVNDLMNIVVAEKLKTIDTNVNPIPIKRHASFDQSSSSNGYNDHTMNKKRYPYNHQNKKRSFMVNSNPLPTILSANNTPILSRTTTNTNVEQHPPISSVIENHLSRPQFVLNRYGDIGNYVPKLLRENTSTSTASMRSSDSNENIFFRASNGHLLNGFLNLDFSSPTTTNGNHNNNNNHQYRSSPCLNENHSDRNILSLVKQLRKTQTKSFLTELDPSLSNQTFHMETTDHDHHLACRIPRVTLQSQLMKPHISTNSAVTNGVRVLPLTSHPSEHPLKSVCKPSITKPRRVASFTIADTELPINYRQYLRRTDQAVYLYGEEQQRQHQKPATLEHSLGYYP